MQPKNSNERKKAFISFLLLFVLSSAIFILLSFFSTRAPLKHNERLESQISAFEREKEFSKNFMNQMLDIVNMIDSVSKSVKPELLEGEVTDKISKLNIKVNNDSVSNKMLYQIMVLNLSDLQSAKKQIRDMAGKNTDEKELQNKLMLLQASYDQCQRDAIRNSQLNTNH